MENTFWYAVAAVAKRGQACRTANPAHPPVCDATMARAVAPGASGDEGGVSPPGYTDTPPEPSVL